MLSIFRNFLGKKQDHPGLDLSEWYDLAADEYAGFSEKELAGLRDTRELHLPPVFIDDGIAFFRDGRLASAMEVASVSFSLAGPDEQQATVGGFHGLLLQLSPELEVQFKVRLTEATLEPQIQRIDYAMRRSNNPLLQQRAMEVKQFYQEFPARRRLLERRGLCLAGLRCRELLELEKTYRERTGRPSFLFNPDHREIEFPRRRNGPKKGPARNLAGQKKEELQAARQWQELEQQLHLQLEKHRQKLRQEAHLLLRGFAGGGMQVRLLPDWELVALFAEYLRPEMAGPGRPVEESPFLFRGGWYGQAAPPRSTAYRLGEQSGSFVAGQDGGTAAYREGQAQVARAMTRPGAETPAGTGGGQAPPVPGPGETARNTRYVTVPVEGTGSKQ